MPPPDVKDDWPEGAPYFRYLDRPRPLTPKERAILDVLLTSPLARPELHEQAKDVLVQATCGCGCPSVLLQVAAGAPRASYARNEESYSGAVDIQAWQRKSRWPWTEVVLHVFDGELYELEIWAGKYGVRPRVDPAQLEFDESLQEK